MRHELKNLRPQNMLQLTMQIAGVVVILLNLYLASKLAPLAEGIHANTAAINVIAADYARKSTVDTGFAHTESALNRIEANQTRIEEKLDRMLGR